MQQASNLTTNLHSTIKQLSCQPHTLHNLETFASVKFCVIKHYKNNHDKYADKTGDITVHMSFVKCEHESATVEQI